MIAAAHLALAALTAIHAMVYKRDPRAALGWVSVCVLFPLFGPFFYFMFGINRIHTQAHKLQHDLRWRWWISYERGIIQHTPATPPGMLDPRFSRFLQISDRLASQALSPGNSVEMLKNGAQSYPAMLQAIDEARERVYLTTYIFDADEIGDEFVAALGAACKRGVDVRVIIDGVGELYSWPRVSRRLRRVGIEAVRFLPPRLFPPAFTINLRNHRKILVVDSSTAFTGGMNIGARHLVDESNGTGTADLHFRMHGPIVRELQAIFADDWQFASGESLALPDETPESHGEVCCRCISDGPNGDLDRISLSLMAAISAAQHSLTIVTPYFLPSREMIASLQSAALRGVSISIILPEKSNLRFVDWATRNLLWELLQYSVNVLYQPSPFAHTKLFIVDGLYAQVGSANIDPRSLRLNFELNIEIFGEECVAGLADYASTIQRTARPVSLQEVDGRSLPVRIRDATCWLFLPYL
ncbi:MAG: cardiolipin synthase [Gammaproteobacteria bacterium]|nr:cardiolipin synthase [Gammaproteobacteria bacterium]